CLSYIPAQPLLISSFSQILCPQRLKNSSLNSATSEYAGLKSTTYSADGSTAPEEPPGRGLNALGNSTKPCSSAVMASSIVKVSVHPCRLVTVRVTSNTPSS